MSWHPLTNTISVALKAHTHPLSKRKPLQHPQPPSPPSHHTASHPIPLHINVLKTEIFVVEAANELEDGWGAWERCFGGPAKQIYIHVNLYKLLVCVCVCWWTHRGLLVTKNERKSENRKPLKCPWWWWFGGRGLWGGMLLRRRKNKLSKN